MNKKSIEQEAEELYPHNSNPVSIHDFQINNDNGAKRVGYIAAATEYSEQQRQVIADTWEAGFRRALYRLQPHANAKEPDKEEFLNNLFPSEIKGEQQ